jgi:hypothetical protein
MKKFWWGIIPLLFVGIFALNSCEKSVATNDDNDLVDVVMQINHIFPQQPNAKKGTPHDETIPECREGTPDHVEFIIDDGYGTYTATADLLENLEEGDQTCVFKAKPGKYIVSSFTVMDDKDSILWASPVEGSYYDNLFNFEHNVAQTIVVEPFMKKKYTFDVMCWQDWAYEKFGYTWFQFRPAEAHTICFFGDICAKDWEKWHLDIDGNPYAGQPHEGYDFGWIGSVVLTPNNPDANWGPLWASNADWYGVAGKDNEGPLCIEYLDDLWVEGETFNVDIYAYLPNGDSLLVDSITVNEDEWSGNGFGGEDGIFDFQIGNCQCFDTSPDAIYPPIQLLPANGNISIVGAGISTGHYNYFEITLEGSSWNGPFYPTDVFEGAQVNAWCGDITTAISTGKYNVNVYSSLNLDAMPAYLDGYPFGALNWLANSEQAIADNLTDATELQTLIWCLVHGDNMTEAALTNLIHAQANFSNVDVSAGLAAAAQLKADHNDFIPQPGDYAVVIFDPIVKLSKNNSTKPAYQLLIVKVDP